ncbi:hypothetical protein F5878DRAFT_62068 [Lentinula raphanica]|uniref:Uncharacterized protein n=1 Tax=Lentinula raphanica TaxID=153919 RepID=A0AA38NW55_9AGAR|nr:hypothetical protein F5880DRAFT_1705889 [Lentinula raphanica]KAJ3831640.1 hypothetical protein F5878DRAFT_62068 [Lentinula raphanica]
MPQQPHTFVTNILQNRIQNLQINITDTTDTRPVPRQNRNSRAQTSSTTSDATKMSNRASVVLDPRALRVLRQAASPSLIRQIQRVNKFLFWCAHRDIAPADVSPPSEILLCNYFSTFSSKTTMEMAKAHSIAIRSWIEGRGFRWTGASLLDNIMKGINNAAKRTSPKTLRTPVHVDDLRVLVNKRVKSANRHFIACRNAAASTAFYGLFKLREILHDTNATENWIPKVRDLTYHSDREQFTLHLPRTKAEPSYGEDITFPCLDSHVDPDTDPIYLLQQHILINKLSSDDYLFSYRRPNGKLTRMKRSKFLEDCNDVWWEHDFSDEMTDYCFRRGGTRHYLVSGISSKIVKRMGRRESDAFLHDLNWEDIEAVISIHLKKLDAIRIAY